jgi:hypothetical protein
LLLFQCMTPACLSVCLSHIHTPLTPLEQKVINCCWVWGGGGRNHEHTEQIQFYNNEPIALLSSSCSWNLRVLHSDTNSSTHSFCLTLSSFLPFTIKSARQVLDHWTVFSAPKSTNHFLREHTHTHTHTHTPVCSFIIIGTSLRLCVHDHCPSTAPRKL